MTAGIRQAATRVHPWLARLSVTCALFLSLIAFSLISGNMLPEQSGQSDRQKQVQRPGGGVRRKELAAPRHPFLEWAGQ
jgi:hypothetical protein